MINAYLIRITETSGTKFCQDFFFILSLFSFIFFYFILKTVSKLFLLHNILHCDAFIRITFVIVVDPSFNSTLNHWLVKPLP